MSASPVFIAFEGCDASGKSTQAALTAGRLNALLTKEPGDTPAGVRIRSLLLDHSPEGASLCARAEALLMAADRAQHVHEVIEPTMRSGRSVVCDRYIASSMAYQGYGRALAVDQIRWISEWATEGLWPDVVILLRVPIDVIVSRLGAAGDPDRLESEGREFLTRVIDGFDAIAAADPERWRVVDGVGTVEEVAVRVLAALSSAGVGD
jgi:dTMP kinase